MLHLCIYRRGQGQNFLATRTLSTLTTRLPVLCTIRFNLCQIIPPLLCVKILGLFHLSYAFRSWTNVSRGSTHSRWEFDLQSHQLFVILRWPVITIITKITTVICDSQVAGEDPQRIGIMVASHNEDTVRFKFQYFRDEILIKRLFWVLRTLSWFRLVASSKPPRGLCKIEITIFLTLFFPGSLWSWPYGRAWS